MEVQKAEEETTVVADGDGVCNLMAKAGRRK